MIGNAIRNKAREGRKESLVVAKEELAGGEEEEEEEVY